ncbi:MAG TPA: RES family NAD+ phosphorylase [Methylococcaceae bacterium]|jgi:RES domain-containing protein|nr:RES family NAD+ phosphorylase [Methylococcaceae bacterium]
MRIWRISNHAELKGLGGLVAGGRWHQRGHPVVYCAESPAAALLETVVHLEIGDPDDVPEGYQLLEIEVPDSVSRAKLDSASLPDDWRHQPGVTQSIGQGWLTARQAAILTVPNAIVPHTFNCLINPIHPESGEIRTVSSVRYPFDDRLFKTGTSSSG